MAVDTGTTARPRRLALAAAAAVVLLGATACGGPAEMPDDADHSAASASPSAGSPATDDGAAVTIPRVGVAAGVLQASGLGFDLSSDATAEQLTQLRDDPADPMAGVVVAPSSCEAPLAQMNWSPTLVADSADEAALTQFRAGDVAAIGTIEVARIDDREQLDAHYATVRTLLDECSSVTLNLQKPGADGGVVPTSGPLKHSEPETGYPTDSAVFWSLLPNLEDQKQQSLVLIREAGDYVAMVSFSGPENISDPEFTQMAESILEVTVLELEAQQQK